MEQQELKSVDVTIKIAHMELVSFELADVADRENIDHSQFAFEYSVNVRVEASSKTANIECAIKVFNDLSKTKYLGSIKSLGIFEVVNFEDVAKDNLLPTNVLAVFTGLLISSTRGFLLLKGKGTILENAMLPIIDPNAFFKKPVS